MENKLKYPDIRSSIIHCLGDLIDAQRQESWYDKNYKHAFWDSLDYYVFEYLNNMDFEMDPEENVGVSVYDMEEATKIGVLIDSFHDTFEPNMPDDYYVNHQDWPKLMEMTREVLELMKSNNEKYNFAQNLSDYEAEDEAKRIREMREG